MEKIKEKLNALRTEADAAVDRAEAAEAKNKQLDQVLLQREQEITSLQHRLDVANAEIDKLDGKLTEAKHHGEEGDSAKSTADNLQRKIQVLEDELDNAEKNLKETVEKLRQVDIKAEHYERQVHRAEQERDAMEKKYEDTLAKYQKSKQELDELVATMEGI